MMINCDLLFSQFRKYKRGMRFVAACFIYFSDRNSNRTLLSDFNKNWNVSIYFLYNSYRAYSYNP